MKQLISVVMGVFNGGESLESTVKSVLRQTHDELEFIVVDDGSTDDTPEILDDLAAQDKRMVVLRQENRGLTQSLMRGCSAARGEFIARQDSGDESHASRLSTQLESMKRNPEAVMVACGAIFTTPDGDALYDSVLPGLQLDDGIRRLSATHIKGPPHHGGTMFRRKAYLACGGYRASFAVAQDIDLWLRMSELGTCLGNSQILYRASVEPNGISTTRSGEQRHFTKLAIRSAVLRRDGYEDTGIFEEPGFAPVTSNRSASRCRADYYYFVASTLSKRDPEAARRYLARALENNPWHWKARIRALQLVLG